MKTKKEALKILEETFLNYYTKRLDEDTNTEKYMTLDEFAQYGRKLINEKYDMMENERDNV